MLGRRYPNIDRWATTAGRYEGAKAVKAVPFPGRPPSILNSVDNLARKSAANFVPAIAGTVEHLGGVEDFEVALANLLCRPGALAGGRHHLAAGRPRHRG